MTSSSGNDVEADIFEAQAKALLRTLELPAFKGETIVASRTAKVMGTLIQVLSARLSASAEKAARAHREKENETDRDASSRQEVKQTVEDTCKDVQKSPTVRKASVVTAAADQEDEYVWPESLAPRTPPKTKKKRSNKRNKNCKSFVSLETFKKERPSFARTADPPEYSVYEICLKGSTSTPFPSAGEDALRSLRELYTAEGHFAIVSRFHFDDMMVSSLKMCQEYNIKKRQFESPIAFDTLDDICRVQRTISRDITKHVWNKGNGMLDPTTNVKMIFFDPSASSFSNASVASRTVMGRRHVWMDEMLMNRVGVRPGDPVELEWKVAGKTSRKKIPMYSICVAHALNADGDSPPDANYGEMVVFPSSVSSDDDSDRTYHHDLTPVGDEDVHQVVKLCALRSLTVMIVPLCTSTKSIDDPSAVSLSSSCWLTRSCEILLNGMRPHKLNDLLGHTTPAKWDESTRRALFRDWFVFTEYNNVGQTVDSVDSEVTMNAKGFHKFKYLSDYFQSKYNYRTTSKEERSYAMLRIGQNPLACIPSGPAFVRPIVTSQMAKDCQKRCKNVIRAFVRQRRREIICHQWERDTQKRLGFTDDMWGVRHSGLLCNALTTKQYSNSRLSIAGTHHYDALEKLGDGVYEYAAATVLFERSSSSWDGRRLEKYLNALKRNVLLTCVGKLLGLDDVMRRANDEIDQTSDKIVADLVESYVGALYLHRGYTVVRKLIKTLLLHPHLKVKLHEKHAGDRCVQSRDAVASLKRGNQTTSGRSTKTVTVDDNVVMNALRRNIGEKWWPGDVAVFEICANELKSSRYEFIGRAARKFLAQSYLMKRLNKENVSWNALNGYNMYERIFGSRRIVHECGRALLRKNENDEVDIRLPGFTDVRLRHASSRDGWGETPAISTAPSILFDCIAGAVATATHSFDCIHKTLETFFETHLLEPCPRNARVGEPYCFLKKSNPAQKMLDELTNFQCRSQSTNDGRLFVVQASWDGNLLFQESRIDGMDLDEDLKRRVKDEIRDDDNMLVMTTNIDPDEIKKRHGVSPAPQYNVYVPYVDVAQARATVARATSSVASNMTVENVLDRVFFAVDFEWAEAKDFKSLRKKVIWPTEMAVVAFTLRDGEVARKQWFLDASMMEWYAEVEQTERMSLSYYKAKKITGIDVKRLPKEARRDFHVIHRELSTFVNQHGSSSFDGVFWSFSSAVLKSDIPIVVTKRRSDVSIEKCDDTLCLRWLVLRAKRWSDEHEKHTSVDDTLNDAVVVDVTKLLHTVQLAAEKSRQGSTATPMMMTAVESMKEELFDALGRLKTCGKGPHETESSSKSFHCALQDARKAVQCCVVLGKKIIAGYRVTTMSPTTSGKTKSNSSSLVKRKTQSSLFSVKKKKEEEKTRSSKEEMKHDDLPREDVREDDVATNTNRTGEREIPARSNVQDEEHQRCDDDGWGRPTESSESDGWGTGATGTACTWGTSSEIDVDAICGEWEKYSNGFASSLMKRMGYKEGEGLGRNNQGQRLAVGVTNQTHRFDA